jgi:hypothetical protein
MAYTVSLRLLKLFHYGPKKGLISNVDIFIVTYHNKENNTLLKIIIDIWGAEIALGYGLDDREFVSRQRLGIFLFTTASRPALRPTQPPIQWVPGVLSLGVKRPGREADHSPPPSADIKNAWSYISTPQ